MKIAFTGKLVSMTRKKAAQNAATIGLTFTSSIAASVLVVGDKPGSRLQKAKARGTHIISESQFIEWLMRAKLTEESA